MKICICTSYPAVLEPRGPRYTATIAKLAPSSEILFIDCVPFGREYPEPGDFSGVPNIRRRTCYFPWRGGRQLELVREKAQMILARAAFRASGTLRPEALSTKALSVQKMLSEEEADVYGGFNIDTLIPVANAAARRNAPVFFDCQEFYSEMAHRQTRSERAVIRGAERRFLPDCSLILSASPEMSHQYETVYGLRNVLPLYNAAPLESADAVERVPGFTLYWRNGVIDLGPRGLDDILRAMPLLPADVRLYLQGRPAMDGGKRVDALLRKLHIADRVTVLPPYRPHEAVRAAAPYSVGLSLESPDRTNLDVTVSNKFFDYAMAGLAIVTSSTKGVLGLAGKAGMCLTYEAGDIEGLQAQVKVLYRDAGLLARLKEKARSFALGEGNLEFQMEILARAFRERVLARV